MRSRWCALVIVIAVAHFAGLSSTCAQSVTGKVVDADGDSSLPGANVFISGTTFGAATLDDGSFTITGLDAGVQDLVVSMVGYHPVVKSINVPTSELNLPAIRLVEEVLDAGEVLVTAERPKDWLRDLERFRREFVGRSPNADECVILNPHVLDFETESAVNRLKASAARPLEIENRALGYRITFVMEDFEVSSWTYSIRFMGQPRFEELEPADQDEADRWEINRRLAYRGSFQHFLYSFVRGTHKAAGYRLGVGPAEILDPDRVNRLPSPEPDSILIGGLTPFERLMYSPDPLHVTYVEETEPRSYQRFMSEVTGSLYAGRAQHSVLVFERGVTVHKSGYLYEPYVVTTYGYWLWERVADMLPRNYRPADAGPESSADTG